MSISQMRAIFDRLAELERRVAELERLCDPDDNFRDKLIVRTQAPAKRGPGRPRKEPLNGQV